MRYTWPQDEIRKILEQAQTSTVEIKKAGFHASKCLRMAIYKHQSKYIADLKKVSVIIEPTEEENIYLLRLYVSSEESIDAL